MAVSPSGARQRIALLESQVTKRADCSVLRTMLNPELAPSPVTASFGYEAYDAVAHVSDRAPNATRWELACAAAWASQQAAASDALADAMSGSTGKTAMDQLYFTGADRDLLEAPWTGRAWGLASKGLSVVPIFGLVWTLFVTLLRTRRQMMWLRARPWLPFFRARLGLRASWCESATRT